VRIPRRFQSRKRKRGYDHARGSSRPYLCCHYGWQLSFSPEVVYHSLRSPSDNARDTWFGLASKGIGDGTRHFSCTTSVRTMRIAVVISSWVEHRFRYVGGICDSMVRHPAGLDYDIFLSVNGREHPPPANLVRRFSGVFTRENVGYNLGAWDYAWRHLPGYDRFLFLQDECIVKRARWLEDFVRRFDATPACGLVGEHLIAGWHRSWDDLVNAALNAHSPTAIEQCQWASFYRRTLARWGIPEGPTARHLTTVVHFTSRSILEEVDGYNIGHSYREAIAAEIGFSRKIEARGYRLMQIGRRRHSRIGHPQWDRRGFLSRLRRSVWKRLP